MQTGVPFTRISFAVAPRGQSAPLGAAPARLLRPIRPRPTAPGRSALSGRGRPIITGPQPLRDCWSQPLQSRRFLNRWSPTCSTAPARDFRHLTRQLAQNTATRMTSGSAVSCAKIRAETVEACSLTLDLSLTLTLALAPALALALALPSSGPDLGPRLPAAEAPRARLVGWLRLRAPRCRMRSRNLYTT